MEITKDRILGARIVDVFLARRVVDGLDHVEHYFVVDRGFAFRLPYAGFRWLSEAVPSSATPCSDRQLVRTFAVKSGLLGRQKLCREADGINDTILRIKAPQIAALLCGPFEPNVEFPYPCDVTMVMTDGWRLTCNEVAPHGTGAAGLYYLPPDQNEIARMTDFFSVPVVHDQAKSNDVPNNRGQRKFDPERAKEQERA